MPGASHSPVVLEAVAVVHRVDVVKRELVVIQGKGFITVYVPPDCEVVLRGERVKLRMLQPRDRVRIVYSETAACAVAHEIEVQTGRTYSRSGQ